MRPEVRERQVARAIAANVGLPTSAGDPFADDKLVHLNRTKAAHVLAVAGTTSLTYGRASPRRAALKGAKEALADYAEDATFFGNGRWEDAPSLSWTPLTTATFECGLIGFDDERAFIFWVEEED
ncbi:hypothetical protein [uncultured Sphingomonas sp.]|uniref:hypothetical protein n=1 Tax=uncultured Sphingomonas sp. TaxID=158754 RepID=UPI0035CC0DCE